MTRKYVFRTASADSLPRCPGLLLRLLSFLSLVLLSSSLVSAEPQNSKNAFFAVSVGGFSSGLQGFDQYYPSHVALSYGGMFGAPMWDRLHVFVKLRYSSKAGIPHTYLRYVEGGIPLSTPKIENGIFAVREWMLNLGGLYEIVSSTEVAIAIEGGVMQLSFNSWSNTYAVDGPQPTAPVPNHSMAGLFAGLFLEHVFAGSRFSTFLEASYSQLWPTTQRHVRGYGVLDFSGGVCVYLGAL